MAASGSGSGTNWSVIIAAGALVLAIAGNVLGVVTGGTQKLEDRVKVIENDLTWKYVTREFAAKDIGYIDRSLAELKVNKTDRDIYDQKVTSIERQLSLLRERVKDLDQSVNQTFNTKDAFTALQTRILELERAGRK